MDTSILSLDTVCQSLSAETRKKVDRLKIRECDEHPKGRFIAYIDEGDQSFDALVALGKGKSIIEHACDCGLGNTFCIHRIALLLHTSGTTSKTKTANIPKAKKKLPYELVIENIDVEELKSWVVRLFSKNKDLELAFMSHFNPESKNYTVEDAMLLTVQGRKAVIKNRRKAEVSEVKKIVELWKDLHQPLLDAFRSSLGDEKMFKVFNALLISIADQQNSIDTGSKAMVKYLYDLLHKTVEPVRNLVLDTAWEKAVGLFVRQLGDESIQLNHAYVEFLMELAAVSSEERNLSIVEALLVSGKKMGGLQNFIQVQQLKQLLNKTVEAKLFEKHADQFKPLLYQNDFNLDLIDVLINHNLLGRAEQVALEQIERNVRDEYDFAYYLKLKEIYSKSGDVIKLAKVTTLIFNINFDYRDFVFLQSEIKDEKKQKIWTEKIYDKAEMAAKHGHELAEIFCFTFLYFENELSKMVALVCDTWDYETLVYYFDEMQEAEPLNLLGNIITRSNRIPYWQPGETLAKQRKWYKPLAEKIIAVYTPEDIRNAILTKQKGKYNHEKGRFTIYLEEKIKSLI